VPRRFEPLHPPRSLVVRMEAHKLDGVWGHRYDTAANTAEAFQAGA
jgi:hypothetical protein